MEARIGQLLEHARWVRGLARCLTHDDATADDLAQDAWIAALLHPPREATRGWLGAVVRNTRRMALRGEHRRRAREDASVDPDARVESAADLADEVELGRVLAEALLELPEPYRETLLLTFYRDLTSAQVGVQRGVPAATVRTHVKVGLEKLRRALDGRYGERATWKRALLPIAAVPRVVVEGALMVKATTLAIAAAGVVGIFAVQHHAKSDPPTRPPPIVAAARTALETRIAQLRQQKPAHDALVAAIEAKKPPQPSVPSPSTPSAHNVPGGASWTGDLDPDYMRAAMVEAMPLFEQCFEDALVDHPDLEGKIRLEFTIEGDPDVGGVVSTSHVDDANSTIALPQLHECFEQTIYAARFPAPADHGVVVVSYPFVLLTSEPDGGNAP